MAISALQAQVPTKQSLMSLGLPTRKQVIHGTERVVGVFVVTFVSFLAATNYSLNKVTVHGAILAGAMAAYETVKSFTTNI